MQEAAQEPVQQEVQEPVQQQVQEDISHADDPYRVRSKERANPKGKVMSSMILARPPATGVQDDMERLVSRLKTEIKEIETTLTVKMDKVEHQIKNLPEARPRKEAELPQPQPASRPYSQP